MAKKLNMGALTSVWHYTTAEGLRDIVNDRVLWATSHRFMNDSREPKHATMVLEEAATTKRKTLDPAHVERFDRLMGYAARKGLEAFLLCAARKPDLLTVWRGYGSSVPYAIELDATVDLLPVEQNAAAEPDAPDEETAMNEAFRRLLHDWTRRKRRSGLPSQLVAKALRSLRNAPVRVANKALTQLVSSIRSS